MNARFKYLRQQLGVSQEDLGKAIGLSKSGISNIESGNRNVNEKHIRMLQLSYNVNPEWLRTGEGKMLNTVDNSILSNLQNQYNLSPAAISIINSLTKMSNEEQELFLELAKKAFNSNNE